MKIPYKMSSDTGSVPDPKNSTVLSNNIILSYKRLRIVTRLCPKSIRHLSRRRESCQFVGNKSL